MKKVFVDTNYFVAIFNPADQWHQKAIEADEKLVDVWLVTTEFVLVEVLNYFSSYKPNIKQKITDSVWLLIDEIEIQIVECSHESFQEGLNLYGSRFDKGYSLTDCDSMNVMREQNIIEILTHDEHFTQEGFQILLWCIRLMFENDVRFLEQFR